jgi:hypothetical protein
MTHRKPSAAFWITVALVAVLAGYPLSFGPARWIASRYEDTTDLPDLYMPIGWIMYLGSAPIRRAFSGYAMLGMPRHTGVPVPYGNSTYFTIQ